jgi:hypothetical protein
MLDVNHEDDEMHETRDMHDEDEDEESEEETQDCSHGHENGCCDYDMEDAMEKHVRQNSKTIEDEDDRIDVDEDEATSDEDNGRETGEAR